MTRLGKYEIGELIGEGGFGFVYKAEDVALQRPVALKILKLQFQDVALIQRFSREAQIAAGLNHPNVVTIYDSGEVDQQFFIAMEYLPGGSLQQRLEQGGLDWKTAAGIIASICDGLQMAHQKGLVHRDLKPGNILFRENGVPVLTDFGLARSIHTLSSASFTNTSGAGTPFYKAPEIWLGKPAPGPATDVYALACVLYEVLTGRILFGGETSEEVITRHLVLKADFGSNFPPPGVPSGVRDLLVQSLQGQMDQRPRDAGAFAKALDALNHPQPPRPMQQTSAPPMVKPAPVQPVEKKNTMREFLISIGLLEEDQGAVFKRAQADIQAGRWEDARRRFYSPGLLRSKEGRQIYRQSVIGQTQFLCQRRQYDQAQQALVLWLKIEPGDEQALTLNDSIHLDIARDLMRIYHWAPALKEVNTVLKRKPGYPEAMSLVDEILLSKEQDVLRLEESRCQPDRVETLAFGVQMLFRQVPAGEFLYGDPPQTQYQPQYWIGKYPVTCEQYAAFLKASGYAEPATLGDLNRSASFPVTNVTLADAREFCKWARLMTQADFCLPGSMEWEKAARGVDGRIYPWGNQNPSRARANYDGNVGRTTPVGKYNPSSESPCGCADMAGNVWEWLEDPEKNLAGGSWRDNYSNIRVIARSRLPADSRQDAVGFRCLIQGTPDTVVKD